MHLYMLKFTKENLFLHYDAFIAGEWLIIIIIIISFKNDIASLEKMDNTTIECIISQVLIFMHALCSSNHNVVRAKVLNNH